MTKARTRTIDDNGFNPVWDETLALSFDMVKGMEDLGFVRFEVRDDGSVGADKVVAAYTVPLGCLNLGALSSLHW